MFVDGDLPGGLPKAVEFFTLQEIPDLSIYGVTSANNGSNNDYVDTVEWNFPVANLQAAEFFYLTTDSAAFRDFFGIDADWAVNIGVHTPASVNGDDAILLYEGNGPNIVRMVDVFGEREYVGPSNFSWEHQDGWVYRNDFTGPDGDTFIESNWTIALGGLEDASTNASATNPFPIGSYQGNVGIENVDANQFINILNNPVGNTLFFKIQHDQTENVEFKIIDLLGNLVQRKSGLIHQGHSMQRIDVSSLSKGIYFLTIEQGNTQIVRKWIKQ